MVERWGESGTTVYQLGGEGAGAKSLGDSPLRERYEADTAVRLLFASGNPEPQAEFSGDGSREAAAVLTRKLVPFAWIELKYSISCSGVAGLEVRSSAVPSISWYGDGDGAEKC